MTTELEQRRRILENARDGRELYEGCGDGKALGRAQDEMIHAISKGWIARTEWSEADRPAFAITEEGRVELVRLGGEGLGGEGTTDAVRAERVAVALGRGVATRPVKEKRTRAVKGRKPGQP